MDKVYKYSPIDDRVESNLSWDQLIETIKKMPAIQVNPEPMDQVT